MEISPLHRFWQTCLSTPSAKAHHPQLAVWLTATLRYRLLIGLCLLVLGLSGAAGDAPTPLGAWLTSDRTGVIGFTACGPLLCGRIVGIVMDQPDEPTPRDHAGRSECSLPIIDDAAEVKPGIWQGHITDPRNGDVYRARLWPDQQGRLYLRGYILIPLLGQTQIWTRYRGPLPADCHLSATNGAQRGAGGP